MDHETQAKGIPSCTFLPCRMAFIIMRIKVTGKRIQSTILDLSPSCWSVHS